MTYTSNHVLVAVTAGRKAKLDGQADDGIGWTAGFRGTTSQRHTAGWASVYGYQWDDYRVMTGWPEGTWDSNSVWAALTYGGNFSLSVTCTSLTGRSEMAWVLNGVDPLIGDVPDRYLYPWTGTKVQL